MTDSQKSQTSFPTQGIQSIYANVANVTLSFHDMRIYLSEVSPVEVDAQILEENPSRELEPKVATVHPLVCVIVNPEFARNLRDALSIAIEKYEGHFGPMRKNPTQLVQTKEK